MQQSDQIIPLLNSCMTSVCTYLVSVANFKLLKCKEMCPELKTKTRPKTQHQASERCKALTSWSQLFFFFFFFFFKIYDLIYDSLSKIKWKRLKIFKLNSTKLFKCSNCHLQFTFMGQSLLSLTIFAKEICQLCQEAGISLVYRDEKVSILSQPSLRWQRFHCCILRNHLQQ